MSPDILAVFEKQSAQELHPLQTYLIAAWGDEVPGEEAERN